MLPPRSLLLNWMDQRFLSPSWFSPGRIAARSARRLTERSGVRDETSLCRTPDVQRRHAGPVQGPGAKGRRACACECRRWRDPSLDACNLCAESSLRNLLRDVAVDGIPLRGTFKVDRNEGSQLALTTSFWGAFCLDWIGPSQWG